MFLYKTPVALLGAPLMLLGVSVVAHEQEVKHPCLLVTAEQIEEIKKNIDTYPWAKELWEKVKGYADRAVVSSDVGNVCVWETGLAYALTKEEKYKEPIRRYLLALSKRPADQISWQWGPRPVQAPMLYDMTYALFSEEEHSKIQAYFRGQARAEIEVRKTEYPTPNMSAHAHMSVGLIGFCLGG